MKQCKRRGGADKLNGAAVLFLQALKFYQPIYVRLSKWAIEMSRWEDYCVGDFVIFSNDFFATGSIKILLLAFHF
jgi:hypothetical protein